MISGDLLSGAGLLLALVGLLYSVWYDEMNRALAVPVARHRLDREPKLILQQFVMLCSPAQSPSSLLPLPSSSSLLIQRLA
jgi:hypothetical protein